MALHFEMLGCMYVCVRECFRVFQCARMCVYVRVHANVLGLYFTNCANAQASHIQSSFRRHGEFENENTFALAPSQRLLSG